MTNPVRVTIKGKITHLSKASAHAQFCLAGLGEVDWDFRDANTSFSSHVYHPYPARFIPQIPGKIIEELTARGETVYDPFVGGGTTLLEANMRGRNAMGNDVSELAVLISRVKTTPIKPEAFTPLGGLIHRIMDKLHKGIIPEKPVILNLDHWFKGFVADEISVIANEIKKIPCVALADFCRVALSSILIGVSNQDSDTRYTRVEKNIARGDTVKRFTNRLAAMQKIMLAEHAKISMGKSSCVVADTRNEIPFAENSADLVVTSPPYPNAYDYHLYHKHRFSWLGMDLLFLRKNEIGAHADYSKKNGHSQDTFCADMAQCLTNISRILKKNRHLAIVIGDSILRGRRVRNDTIIKKAAGATPLAFVVSFGRDINLRKKSFNPAIGNIKKEKIMVFQNLK